MLSKTGSTFGGLGGTHSKPSRVPPALPRVLACLANRPNNEPPTAYDKLHKELCYWEVGREKIGRNHLIVTYISLFYTKLNRKEEGRSM